MKGDLHSKLQHIGQNYLLGKTFWICGQEVPMPLGICDVWGMSRSLDWKTMAIEVKTSRPDFRSVSQKIKETALSPLGNFQYILCPAGLIMPHEVHPRWGLLWFEGDRLRNKKRAPELEMTAEEKLNILFYFLQNGWNEKRPKLSEIKNTIKPLEQNKG